MLFPRIELVYDCLDNFFVLNFGYLEYPLKNLSNVSDNVLTEHCIATLSTSFNQLYCSFNVGNKALSFG